MEFLTDNDNENLKFLIGGMVALAIMFSLWHFMGNKKPISTATTIKTARTYHAPGAAQTDPATNNPANAPGANNSNPSSISRSNSGAGAVTGAVLKGTVAPNTTPANSAPVNSSANVVNPPPANGANGPGSTANGVNNGQPGVNTGVANRGVVAPGDAPNTIVLRGGAANGGRNIANGCAPVGVRPGEAPMLGAASTGASNSDSMAGNNSSTVVGANGGLTRNNNGNANASQSGTAGGNNQSGTTGAHSVPIHPMTSPGY